MGRLRRVSARKRARRARRRVYKRGLEERA